MFKFVSSFFQPQESLKGEVYQIKSTKSNSSNDFVRISEKFDKMFVDVVTSLRRTTDDQKRLEEKVTFVVGELRSNNNNDDKK